MPDIDLKERLEDDILEKYQGKWKNLYMHDGMSWYGNYLHDTEHAAQDAWLVYQAKYGAQYSNQALEKYGRKVLHKDISTVLQIPTGE